MDDDTFAALERRVAELAGRFSAELAERIKQEIVAEIRGEANERVEEAPASMEVIPPVEIAAHDHRARLEYVAQTQDMLNQDIRLRIEAYRKKGLHIPLGSIHETAFRAAWTTRALVRAAEGMRPTGKLIPMPSNRLRTGNG